MHVVERMHRDEEIKYQIARSDERACNTICITEENLTKSTPRTNMILTLINKTKKQ